MLDLSYIVDLQASLYALLQAVNEISSRGNNRDEDVNVFVQRRYCVINLLLIWHFYMLLLAIDYLSCFLFKRLYLSYCAGRL